MTVYYKAYKSRGSPGFTITSSRIDNEKNTRSGQKIDWAEVGHYYVLLKEGRMVYAIPVYEYDGCIAPRFENGDIAQHYNDELSENFNWDTVNWVDPRYPWEGPHLNKRFWKRQDGEWVLKDGIWIIEFPDGTSIRPKNELPETYQT